ncbi:prepilin-type N-terminal cleavage/methylation domain-containing protein [Aedoeadaptatus acetigenes]|uniref:Prepilin-type N-terminal cleavage/methylation domain-containing protein n=1 Tax=Aedoeadaptatus acetigenes TaxID=2981723 RepID=A0ABV1J4P8_9FIRM|nr:prepilin-type N-terminal cleavage/methylation domain-containing protein [Aedoeadaptatus acetigenes]MBS6524581.1 prepilin-type N-terminal cleavage/methylation domain-containing protein [Peptoniphilaceae bacterium]MCU6786369.1 prepilin-type N-terminal cleavage/methylation domain-containing protein [Aedoeadaptatus acetigenes]
MKKKKGFTLIELIIVIAILALLIAIAIPRYQRSNLSAQATAHNANVRVIKNAAILYSMDKPTEGTIELDDLKPYLESGEVPKPAKALSKYTSFTVKVENGNIIVEPGMVKIDNNNTLVPDTGKPDQAKQK